MHPWHCLYWFLFGSYRGVVLVLVMLGMTRPSSPKTDFVCIFSCVFGFGDFAGPSVQKVSLFHLLVKSPFLGAKGFLFPTKLDSSRSEFPSKSYSVSGSAAFSVPGGGSTAGPGGSTAITFDFLALHYGSSTATGAAIHAFGCAPAAVPPPPAAVPLLRFPCSSWSSRYRQWYRR